MPGFDVVAARKAGYSDDEILQHLTSTRQFDVDGALKAGYSKGDIINHLSGSSSQTTPQVQGETGVWAGIKRGVSNMAALPGQVYHAVADDPRDASEQYVSENGIPTAPGIPGRAALAVKRLIADPMIQQEQQAQQYYAQANGDPNSQAAHMGNMHAIASKVPLVGPVAGELTDRYLSGDKGGALAEGATYIVAPKAAGKVVDAVRGAPNAARGAMSGRMNTKLPGEQFTPQQILDAARDKGINLDLADATGSGVAKGVKAYAERSLGGRGQMKANTDSNLKALEDWADSEKTKYAPDSTPRETLGSQVSERLQEDLAAKKTAASESFSDLDKRVGTNTIDGTDTVEAEARDIIGEMKDYYAKHPELKPKQAWSIMENLAERPKVDKLIPNATAPGLQDVNGNPQYATGTVTKGQSSAHYFSWNELHNLRSDLMDIYRNDPEIIKSKSGAWLQRMVGTIDKTMTDSATGLAPEDLKQFRSANATWEDIKSTYDNPQHPFYQAVRPRFESQVTGMLENKTPELARQVRATIGSLEGPFQRQFVENLLNAKDGSLDLKNLNSRLSRVPDDFLRSMIGDKGAQNLRILGKVSQRVTSNINPSGTSDVAVPAGEIGAASTMLLQHPVVAAGVIGSEVATGYGAARALKSPRMIDYLTKSKTSRSRSTGRYVRRVPLGALVNPRDDRQ